MQVTAPLPDPSGTDRVPAAPQSINRPNYKIEKSADRSSRQRLAEFIFILSVSLAATSLISHLLVHRLGIRSGGVSYKIVGSSGAPPTALAEGSSLMRDAISWQEVSNAIGETIENWFAAGGSPCEWDVLQRRAKVVETTFIGISLYDLNEESLCDARAEIVPFLDTVQDLHRTNADWQFAKRLLTQYPVQLLRALFPTIGRSDGVMVGIRQRLTTLLTPQIPVASETGPIVAPDADVGTLSHETEKISDWSTAHLLRRIASMRTAIRGKHRFDGPKKLALLRMLQRAQSQGRVVVIVLPVSEPYCREFVSPEVRAEFEECLLRARAAAPSGLWFRLDQRPELRSDSYFYDLVHLNASGQQIATGIFVNELRARWEIKPGR